MKINSFEIERFGLWTDLKVPKLSDGVNVFYGANETGKSTILEFVRSQLYGFIGERKRFIRKPAFGGSVLNPEPDEQIGGGTLTLETQSGQYKLRRMYYPADGKPIEEIDLQSADGEKQGVQLLRSLVAGVDENTFNNIFAVGLDELQKIASLSDTEAAEMLFRLSVGTERISIIEAIRDLTARRNSILPVSGQCPGENTKLETLLEQRRQLVDGLSLAKVQVRQYAALRNERTLVDRSIENLQTDLAKWNKEKRTYEIAAAAQPIWQKRDILRETIETMGHVILCGDEVIANLDAAVAVLDQKKTNFTQVKTAFLKAKDEIAALKIDTRVQRNVPRLEMLLEDEERLKELNTGVEKYNADIEGIRSKLNELNTAPQSPALIQCNPLASAVSKAHRALQHTKEQYAGFTQRAKVLNDRIKEELAGRDAKSIDDALSAAEDTLAQLKRRQTLGTKAAELTARHKEMRQVNAFLIQNQALPAWMFALMLIAGILGAVGIGVGVYPEAFGLDKTLALVPVIIGCLTIGGSIAAKVYTEKNNTKKLESNQRQLGVLTQTLDRLNQEIAAIDQNTSSPAASTKIEVRLQAALNDAQHLEKLLPADEQRRKLTQRCRQLEVRLQHCQERYKEAVQHWKDFLLTNRLPEDWTPAQVREYAASTDAAAELRKQLQTKTDILNQKIADGNIITAKIEKAAEDVGIELTEDLTYSGIFEKFRQLLQGNADALKHKEDIIKKVKAQLRPMRKQAAGEIRTAQKKLSDILRPFNAKKADELKVLHQRYREYRKLLSEQQAVQREIDAAIGSFVPEDVIGKIYVSERELAPAVSEAAQRIAALSAKLNAELETKGQITEQMKQLAEDQTVLKKRRELAILDERIRQTKHTWQVLAVCSKMLDEIRLSYERDRQPRTLAEASELLKRLTGGRYQRIWTPLGEETLMLDDADGNTFEVSWLSRGTREQLFIALRLALASEFARHGSILPLVLDDVLVNFDSVRALAAAQLLLDLASTGRQIFVFTCHEHICRMFQKLDIPVWILPVAKPHRLRVLLPISILEKRRKRRLQEKRRLEQAERNRKLAEEIAAREEQIRLDAIRQAEVQRLVVQMQQQATAEKAVEAEQRA